MTTTSTTTIKPSTSGTANDGNNATGITKRTRAELARDQLVKLGWQPVLRTLGGRNPLHEQKTHGLACCHERRPPLHS